MTEWTAEVSETECAEDVKRLTRLRCELRLLEAAGNDVG